MPSTTDNGLPYPLGSDPFSVGDEDIRALAEAVDPHLELPYMSWKRLTAGVITGLSSGVYFDLASVSGSGYEFEKSAHFTGAANPFTYTGPTWWFQVAAYATFASNGVAGNRVLNVLKNGTDSVAHAQQRVDTTVVNTTIATAAMVKLASGDTIRARVQQNSGSVDLEAYSGFSLAPIRPA